MYLIPTRSTCTSAGDQHLRLLKRVHTEHEEHFHLALFSLVIGSELWRTETAQIRNKY